MSGKKLGRASKITAGPGGCVFFREPPKLGGFSFGFSLKLPQNQCQLGSRPEPDFSPVLPRSPSSALLPFWEDSPTKIDYRKTNRVPTCSNLSNLQDLVAVAVWRKAGGTRERRTRMATTSGRRALRSAPDFELSRRRPEFLFGEGEGFPVGMGQNETTRGRQVLVLGSI